ncbi:hypothetical protein ACFX1W_007844 [Malus domestica]
MSVNGIWEIRQTLPFCLLSHLKTIFIKGFKGQRDEMEVAKYLLKNNVVLDKMATSTGDLNCTKEEVHQEFSMFERVSKTCQVEFT